MENETVVEEPVKARSERRSSIFYAGEKEVNVDVQYTNEIQYPPDYYDRMSEEHKKWHNVFFELKNKVLEFKKDLQNPIIIDDMSILDKDQKNFFKNIPDLYIRYVKVAEEYVEETHTVYALRQNVIKCNRELARNLDVLVQSTDAKLKKLLKH